MVIGGMDVNVNIVMEFLGNLARFRKTFVVRQPYGNWPSSH